MSLSRKCTPPSATSMLSKHTTRTCMMVTGLNGTTTKKNSFPHISMRETDKGRTMETFSHQLLESKATSTEVLAKSMRTPSQKSRKRTMNSLFWRNQKKNRAWWQPNLGQFMTFPWVWALMSSRLKQAQIKLEQLWLVAPSDSQTLWVISSRPKVPRTNLLLSLSTRIVNKKSNIHPPTNLRENRHIFHTTRPLQWLNKSLKLYGSTIRTSN